MKISFLLPFDTDTYKISLLCDSENFTYDEKTKILLCKNVKSFCFVRSHFPSDEYLNITCKDSKQLNLHLDEFDTFECLNDDL